MADWNANDYMKFGRERTQPAIDLVKRIPADDDGKLKILDIGCGAGNSSAALAARFVNANIIGMDSSENMLESARKAYPDITFVKADANNVHNEFDRDFDIVFSNACIQWLPNHSELLKNIMSLLKEGGVMAIQLPVNHEEPIHKIISEISLNDKWKGKCGLPSVFHILSQGGYYDVLARISSDFELWETTYCHRMKSHNAIIDWYRTTGLKPYLDLLSDVDKADFESDILARVKELYPIQENGEVIFRFPRLFFIAIR